MIKRFGVVRMLWNETKEAIVRRMATIEMLAPTRSILMRMSIWSAESEEISSQPGGYSIVSVERLFYTKRGKGEGHRDDERVKGEVSCLVEMLGWQDEASLLEHKVRLPKTR